MINAPDAAPSALGRTDAVGRVREALARTGYDENRIPERLDAVGTQVHKYGRSDRPRILWRTRGGDPLATFIRLFVCGVPVGLDDLRRATAPGDPGEWADLGLIAIDGPNAVRKVALLPGDGLVVASDCHPAVGGMRRDHVLELSGSTMTLARTTIRTPARRVLDLGTGCGFQAIAAAAHRERVLATDNNPRAVAFARFNAVLNDTPSVKCARGTCSSPPAGHTVRPDRVQPAVRRLARGRVDLPRQRPEGRRPLRTGRPRAPAHLEEGGFAQFVCNWVRPRGGDWVAALRLVHRLRLRRLGPPLRDLRRRRLRRALAPHERPAAPRRARAAVRPLDGLLRSGGDRGHRRRHDRPPTTDARPSQLDANRFAADGASLTGAGLLRGFAGRDTVNGLSDDRGMLDLVLRVHPDLLLEQTLRPGAGGWSMGSAFCRFTQGLPFIGAVDQAAFHILTLCRGRLPLRDLLAEVAAGRAGTGGDPAGGIGGRPADDRPGVPEAVEG